MAPIRPPADDDEDEYVEDRPRTSAATPNTAPDTLDLEWEKFQQSVLNPPDAHETYQRATLIAEPVLADEVPEGFPPRQETTAVAEPEVVDEEGLRRKKEQEERELIMDRLLDEEQAQEEADAKVSLLKSKMDALKKRREAAKAAKGKKV